jgi:hypothetical protein
MGHLQIHQTVRKGRTYIRIAATARSPKTRMLLRKFKAGLKDIEKRWKAAVAASKKREGKAVRRKR